MPERSFRRFLLESFAVMERDVPGAYAEMCRRLAGKRVHLRVEGDDVSLRFGRGRAELAGDAPPHIEVHTTRRAILALIDAHQTLLDSVLRGDLELRGSPDDLLAFDDGLMAYVHGAVRAPAFATLLRSYRAPAESEHSHAGAPAIETKGHSEGLR